MARSAAARPHTGDVFGDWELVGEPYLLKGKWHVDAVCLRCGRTWEGRYLPNLVRGQSRSCQSCGKRKNPVRKDGTAAQTVRVHKGEIAFKYQRHALVEKAKTGPCVDCGVTYPDYCMQMDHVPERGVKMFHVNWRTVSSGIAIDELRAEIAKCDLVCSNCHDRRTWLRANGLPVTPPPWKDSS
jgi:hypothetical protein